MARFVGLDVSQKLTSICVVDDAGRRLWRGQCHSEPEPIERAVRRHAGDDASIGIETGPMTPWLVHALRGRGLDVVCLDARHASAALKMQMNKTDQNDAEGLAHIVRTGWYRSVHVKSLDAHRTRALLGARAQLVGMTTRLSNHIRGVLKTFGMLPGAMRGVPFDKRVETLLADRDDVAAIVPPMLQATNFRTGNQASVRQTGPKFVEGSINRLFRDLMDAPEGRLRNVEPVSKRALNRSSCSVGVMVLRHEGPSPSATAIG